jgi:DNA polymerase-1
MNFQNLSCQYRHLRKLVSTYTNALALSVDKKDGRIHSVIHQAVASTGRLSSSAPNLQNIPVRDEQGMHIRRAFCAQREDYVLLSADYSQIELRILAHLSRDKALIEAFKSGEDIHSQTAMKIFHLAGKDELTREHRRVAKAINYGIVYGLSAFGLSLDIGVSVKEAKKIIDEYLTLYSGIKEFIEKTVADAEQNGFVTTLLGRKRNLPELSSSSHSMREFAKRTAVNTPVQGTSADILKTAMVNIDKALSERTGLIADMVMTIHDELLFEVHKDSVQELSVLVRDIMQNAIILDVPVVVDVKWAKTGLQYIKEL